MRILHLTLKRKWFDMIASGEKREEYREIKAYWIKRLPLNVSKYDVIQFKNGYGPKVPTMLVELLSTRLDRGISGWGAPLENVFILSLGRVLEISNWKGGES